MVCVAVVWSCGEQPWLGNTVCVDGVTECIRIEQLPRPFGVCGNVKNGLKETFQKVSFSQRQLRVPCEPHHALLSVDSIRCVL